MNLDSEKDIVIAGIARVQEDPDAEDGQESTEDEVEDENN